MKTLAEIRALPDYSVVQETKEPHLIWQCLPNDHAPRDWSLAGEDWGRSDKQMIEDDEDPDYTVLWLGETDGKTRGRIPVMMTSDHFVGLIIVGDAVLDGNTINILLKTDSALKKLTDMWDEGTLGGLSLDYQTKASWRP